MRAACHGPRFAMGPGRMKGPVMAAVSGDCSARPGAAVAAEPDEGREPVRSRIAETVTDIDGTDVGEVELEANGARLRALHGGR